MENLRIVPTTAGQESLSDKDSEILTDKEAAEFLRMSQVTLWRERKAGLISFRRCSGKLGYTRKDLMDYLERAKRGFGVSVAR